MKKKTAKKSKTKKKRKTLKKKIEVKKVIQKPFRQSSTKKAKKTDYRAKDIFILEGLEPVRKRPAMYIGTTGVEGVHHLIYEVVGNAVDEAIMGYCDEIKVTLLSKNRIKVEDNGRGIPVDRHPKTRKSALETVMTYLHAGAKFGGKIYSTTGGLHGVGVSAVCALSEFMKVEIQRDGFKFSQEYVKGKPVTKVKKIGKTRQTGTTVIFQPDSEIFKVKSIKITLAFSGIAKNYL